MIFDGHAYCFPSLKGPGGFSDPDQLRRHLQLAMAGHHQPAWRVRDGAVGDSSALIDPSNWSELTGLKEAGFHAAKNGRFEWTDGGEAYVKQYFPPSITDMSYSPDRLVAEMDYAEVGRALLHRTPYLGIGNDFIAECVRLFPDRLLGLAHVEEWIVAEDPDASVAEVERAVRQGGLSGLQFLTPQLNLYGQRGPWDAPEYLPFWDGFSRLGVPLFISLKGRVDPVRDSYLEEIKTLGRWVERYPDVTVVLTHGIEWRLFADGEGICLPEAVWGPFGNPNLHLQFLFPIGLAPLWDYPMPQVRPTIEECVRRLGSGRIMWGTDMPIVTRYWSYLQNIDFIRRYCDFLSAGQMDDIMGGVAARLMGVAASD